MIAVVLVLSIQLNMRETETYGTYVCKDRLDYLNQLSPRIFLGLRPKLPSPIAPGRRT